MTFDDHLAKASEFVEAGDPKEAHAQLMAAARAVERMTEAQLDRWTTVCDHLDKLEDNMIGRAFR